MEEWHPESLPVAREAPYSVGAWDLAGLEEYMESRLVNLSHHGAS